MKKKLLIIHLFLLFFAAFSEEPPISSRGWHGSSIIDIYVPRRIESMGYVIDFDHMRHISPNTVLASSVKALMKQRNCDVSVS